MSKIIRLALATLGLLLGLSIGARADGGVVQGQVVNGTAREMGGGGLQPAAAARRSRAHGRVRVVEADARRYWRSAAGGSR